MASNPTPSVFRIIQVDYGATLGFGAAVAPVFVLIALIFMSEFDLRALFTNKSIIVAIIAIFLIFTSIGLLILYLRVKSIRSIINVGIEVPGVINQIRATNKRSVINVKCTFNFNNMVHHSSWYTITKAKKYTKFIEPGKNVTMMVDLDNPERVLIKELYV